MKPIIIVKIIKPNINFDKSLKKISLLENILKNINGRNIRKFLKTFTNLKFDIVKIILFII